MIASSLAVVASASVLSGTQVAFADETVENKTFTDLQKGDQGYEQVMALVNQDIIKGFGDNTFGPYKNVTRGQVAVMLSKALKLETPHNVAEILKQYNDVNEESIYANEIAAVTEAGIFKGTNGHFNTFDDITRSQVATVLVKAFGLTGNDTAIQLTDIHSIDESHRENVKILAQNGITIGKQNVKGERYFDGNDSLKRVQFAIFLDKSMKAENAISEVTNETVTISGVEYTIAEQLKGLFNENNEEALKGAHIEFETTEDKITKVSYLEVVNNGQADSALVLDAGNTEIDGNVEVTADFVTLKNVTVTGDLIISGSNFNGDTVTVEGKTVLGAVAEQDGAQIAASLQNEVVFSNSVLAELEINEANINIQAKGTTTVEEVTVNQNASITADENVVIPKLTVAKEATAVEVNANVTNVEVNNVKEVAINGTATIENLVVKADGNLSINIKGNIAKLDASASEAKVMLKEETTVAELALPEGKDATDVIDNYDDVKEQIGKGEENKTPAVDSVAAAFNSATDVESVVALIEDPAHELHLTAYSNLTEGGRQDAVAAALLFAKTVNGEFTSKEEVQAVLDASVDNETHKMQIIKLVVDQDATVEDLTAVLEALQQDAHEILEANDAKVLDDYYGVLIPGTNYTLSVAMNDLIAQVDAYKALSNEEKAEVFAEFQTNEYSGSDVVALGYVKTAMDKLEVKEINTATEVDMKAAIENPEPGLDLTSYNNLTEGGRQDAVAAAVLFARELNGEFANKQAVQAALDTSVDNETHKMEIIQLVNKEDATVEDLNRILNALKTDAEEILNGYTAEQLAALDVFYDEIAGNSLVEGMNALILQVDAYNELSNSEKEAVFTKFQANEYSGSDVDALGYVQKAMEEVLAEKAATEAEETISVEQALENGVVTTA